METIQIRKVDVQDDNVRRGFENIYEGLLGVRGRLDFVSRLNKGCLNTVDELLIIFNKEHGAESGFLWKCHDLFLSLVGNTPCFKGRQKNVVYFSTHAKGPKFSVPPIIGGFSHTGKSGGKASRRSGTS